MNKVGKTIHRLFDFSYEISGSESQRLGLCDFITKFNKWQIVFAPYLSHSKVNFYISIHRSMNKKYS